MRSRLPRSLIAGGMLVPGFGLAASLHVSPVSLRMPAGEMATALTLENQGGQPLVAQVRIFGWDQTLSEDRLQPQDRMQVSPPMARLAPHSVQVVRVIRVASESGPKELTYRLLIDELPDPVARSEHSIDIRLRYSIPLFALPRTPALGPVLNWHVDRRQGRAYLKVINTGDLHAQISAVQVQDARGGVIPVAAGLLGYALAGREREWLLPEEAGLRDPSPLRIRAMVDQQAIETSVISPEVPGK